jgi:cobalt-precorrin-5B (C1)-methyltransferase
MDVTRKAPGRELRRGWTTGACATAATKAAYAALTTGIFPDPVGIALPRGETPAFPLTLAETGEGWARAGIVKDAGDDPDVTHLCMVIATVRAGRLGSGVVFRAGPGVGTVTKPGLPVPPGEPAINPAPREMLRSVIAELGGGDVEIELSIPGGEELATKTWNPRLGIVGGLSILGTTGIVHPYSCSAWIASIQRGVDVARAAGLAHIAGSTGSTSERAAQELHHLPLEAMIDMGDFVGGLLKYLRQHPVDRVTIAGGFGKMVKLAQGALDLHSGRSQVDFNWLAERVPPSVAPAVERANTAQEVLDLCKGADFNAGKLIADIALGTVQRTLRTKKIAADILVVDRRGAIIGHAG